MTSHGYLVCLGFFLGGSVQFAESLFINGCPMFGCRPSGSFSFYQHVPGPDAAVNWVSDLKLQPLPNPYGCVSDSSSIICLNNDLFSGNQGYVSLYATNGSLYWKDKFLNYPSLPLLDNFGDVTGSDGTKLVHYDQDGTRYPVINLQDLRPMFNMALVGDDVQFLLLISGNGNIVAMETNGVPMALLTLNATFDDVNGTFVPVSQPVVNELRFYVLTRFQPTEDTRKAERDNKKRSSSEGATDIDVKLVYRVYAIDIQQQISDRIKVAWFFTFGGCDTQRTKSGRQPAGANGLQSVMYDRSNKLVYVAVNERGPSGSYADTLYGFNDEGGVEFRKIVDIASMSRFVTDHCFGAPAGGAECSERNDPTLGPEALLWIVTPESTIQGVDHTGTTQRTFDLDVIFNSDVNVTSLLSTIRNDDTENDTLIFAVTTGTSASSAYKMMLQNSQDGTVFQFSSQSNFRASYVVAFDTGSPGNGSDLIRWKVPVPNTMVALGQISGVQSSASNDKDQLIVYAEDAGKAAEIFSIS